MSHNEFRNAVQRLVDLGLNELDGHKIQALNEWLKSPVNRLRNSSTRASRVAELYCGEMVKVNVRVVDGRKQSAESTHCYNSTRIMFLCELPDYLVTVTDASKFRSNKALASCMVTAEKISGYFWRLPRDKSWYGPYECNHDAVRDAVEKHGSCPYCGSHLIPGTDDNDNKEV